MTNTTALNQTDIRVLHTAAALADDLGDPVPLTAIADCAGFSTSVVWHCLYKLRARKLVDFDSRRRGTLRVTGLVYEPDGAIEHERL